LQQCFIIVERGQFERDLCGRSNGRAISAAATATTVGDISASGLTGNLTVNAGGRLAGNGATGAVTVNSTGVLAAATTPGVLNAATLTTNGLTTLKSGSVLEWKVNDASGLAGAGYDTFAFGAGLDLSNRRMGADAVVRR
jgi:hypothetical protein